MANDDQTVDTVIENTPSPASTEPTPLESVDDIASALNADDTTAGDNSEEDAPNQDDRPDDAGQDGKDGRPWQPPAPT